MEGLHGPLQVIPVEKSGIRVYASPLFCQVQILPFMGQVQIIADRRANNFFKCQSPFSAMSDWEDLGISWDIPQTLSLIPFLIVQLFTVAFLLRHGRKEKPSVVYIDFH